jgi:formylmethanofuran dehydrogenase subunit E
MDQATARLGYAQAKFTYSRPARKKRAKRCWKCGRAVNKTLGNTGLCKRCIEEARREQL